MRSGMACDSNASNIASKQRTHLKASSVGANPTVALITSGMRTRRANTLPRSGAVVGLDAGQGSSSSGSSGSSKPSHPMTLLPKSPVIPFRSSTLQKGFARLALRKRHGSGPSTPTTPLSSSVPASRALSTPPPYSVLISPRDLPEYRNSSSLSSKMGALLRRHSVDPEARRRGNVANQRSVDGYDAAHNHLYFSRDARDSRSGSLFGSSDPICDRLDFEELGEDENLIYVKFFKFYRCYDLIPISAKLVVFDTQLLVKKAFYALVSNGVRAAPLWDCCNKQFVTMLTITDFINILTTYYKSSLSKIDELEEQKLEAWRNVLKEKSRPMVSIDPDACLLDAIKTLVHNRIHRLPVIDPETGNVIYILTHKRILKFLFLYYSDLPSPNYLNQSIKELKIGTYENIAVTKMNTPLIEALHQFIERRVSALPVVDEKGRVIDVYAKFDVINLAAEKTYNNLDMPIKKALEHRDQYFEGVVKCTVNDSLHTVLEKIVRAEVHRIVVVDDKDYVVGMVSLSDILSFLALKPLSLERKDAESDTLLEESGEEIVEEMRTFKEKENENEESESHSESNKVEDNNDNSEEINK